MSRDTLVGSSASCRRRRSISASMVRVEERERPPHAEMAEPRHPIGHAEQIERIDAAVDLEVARHRGAHLFAVPTEPVGEHGAFERVERETRQLVGHVEQGAAARLPARHQHVGGAHHRRCKADDGLAREGGRQRAPLRAPLLAFDGEQAVPEADREHAQLQRVLAVVGGVVHQHAANGARVAQDRDLPEHQVLEHDRLFEMGLVPSLGRVAPERPAQADERHTLRRRHRRRWPPAGETIDASRR